MKSRRPIIFSTDMIQAYMEGRKTQTRRVIKPQPVITNPDGRWMLIIESTNRKLVNTWEYVFYEEDISASTPYPDPILAKCRYGIPGDSLWFRETYAVVCPEMIGDSAWYQLANTRPCRMHPEGNIMDGVAAAIYKADAPFEFNREYDPRGWRSGRFMPKWASRFEVPIISIRPERLQDISGNDCIAEGFERFRSFWIYGQSKEQIDSMYRNQFKQLWDRVNAKRGYPYESNPWVWRIEFPAYGVQP